MKSVCRCGKLKEIGKRCSCYNRSEYMKQYEQMRGDSEKELRSTKWMKKKKLIKERDNYTCQRCLIKYNIINNEDLQVHHIKPRVKYPELMYDDNNLICICGTCNRQLGTQEQLDFEWKPSQLKEVVL